MKTLYLFIEIYSGAFRDVDNLIVRNYLRAFSLFSFSMFLLALYAFAFHVYAGFAFE